MSTHSKSEVGCQIGGDEGKSHVHSAAPQAPVGTPQATDTQVDPQAYNMETSPEVCIAPVASQGITPQAHTATLQASFTPVVAQVNSSHPPPQMAPAPHLPLNQDILHIHSAHYPPPGSDIPSEISQRVVDEAAKKYPPPQQHPPRSLGAKSFRDEDLISYLTRSSRLDEREIDLLKRENALLRGDKEKSSASSGVSDAGAAGIHLINQRSNFWETSAGEWKSTKLKKVFPTNWPTYSWPKKWKHATAFTRSLTLLCMFQEKHVSLRKALSELKLLLKEEKKSLTSAEANIFEHALVEGASYDLQHSAWEVCLKGTTDAHKDITIHAYVCRKLDPAILRDMDEWDTAVSGGKIPTICTDGIRVGGPSTVVQGASKKKLGIDISTLSKSQLRKYMQMQEEEGSDDDKGF